MDFRIVCQSKSTGPDPPHEHIVRVGVISAGQATVHRTVQEVAGLRRQGDTFFAESSDGMRRVVTARACPRCGAPMLVRSSPLARDTIDGLSIECTHDVRASDHEAALVHPDRRRDPSVEAQPGILADSDSPG